MRMNDLRKAPQEVPFVLSAFVGEARCQGFKHCYYFEQPRSQLSWGNLTHPHPSIRIHPCPGHSRYGTWERAIVGPLRKLRSHHHSRVREGVLCTHYHITKPRVRPSFVAHRTPLRESRGIHTTVKSILPAAFQTVGVFHMAHRQKLGVTCLRFVLTDDGGVPLEGSVLRVWLSGIPHGGPFRYDGKSCVRSNELSTKMAMMAAVKHKPDSSVLFCD